jgi:transposase
MLSQEEFMDLCALKRQGLSNREIGEQLGYHPATIAKWLRAGGPPATRAVADTVRVLDARWAVRVEELLGANGRLLATSVFDVLRAEGFEGSYPTVVRHVRAVRGPRFRAAPQVSVPIETAPGEEAQFDWSDCSDWAGRWGWDVFRIENRTFRCLTLVRP